MSENPLQLTQIDHVGAPVWDADGATAFFELANVPVVLDEEVPEYNIRAVFLDIDGVYLEFLEPTGPGNVKTFLERHGPGYQHVAYRVPDIDAAVDELRAEGVTFRSDAPTAGAGDSRIIFVEEGHTAGFQVELVERNTSSD
jgi:methylmalonyl-CoA/ethylmalonyl-CoA epimerase